MGDQTRQIKFQVLLFEQEGQANAQFNLGVMFANGNGVNQSVAKAREWLTKAAAQGFEEAINGLKQLE